MSATGKSCPVLSKYSNSGSWGQALVMTARKGCWMSIVGEIRQKEAFYPPDYHSEVFCTQNSTKWKFRIQHSFLFLSAHGYQKALVDGKKMGKMFAFLLQSGSFWGTHPAAVFPGRTHSLSTVLFPISFLFCFSVSLINRKIHSLATAHHEKCKCNTKNNSKKISKQKKKVKIRIMMLKKTLKKKTHKAENVFAFFFLT